MQDRLRVQHLKARGGNKLKKHKLSILPLTKIFIGITEQAINQ